MSQNYYIKKWDSAQADLNRLIRLERPKKPLPLPKEKKEAFMRIAVAYIKYITIYQRLIACYDYMVHPQKRILICKVLDGVTGRIVELREELVRVDLNEYVFLGSVCQDLKLTLFDLEMKLSTSMALDRVAKVRQRLQLLDYILATIDVPDDEPVDTGDVYTVQEAVLLIQRNERCFQARTKAQNRKRARRPKQQPKAFTPLEQINERGITLFQALWRGHADRKLIDGLRTSMDRYLGMLMPPPIPGMSIEVIEKSIVSQRFKEAQANDDDYKKDIIVSTELIQEEQGESLKADMKREIMQWILECRNITREFPPYPEEADGGSAVLFANKTMQELEDDMDELEENLAKGTKKAEPKKEKKKAGKKEKPEGFVMKPSNFVDTTLVDCANEYGTYWWYKNERYNRKQEYDRNLMLDDVKANVELILRAEVDKLMLKELDRLRTAIDSIKAGKPKKPGKEKKKKKDKKKKKRKQMKDLTVGVPLENLFKELVVEGIIKKVPDVPLSEFVGNYNLIDTKDSHNVECIQDLGDVRKMVFDFGVLPMSSPVVRLLAPFTKSLLLVGPHGSGKKMLVHALCYELGATFFDLSAENLVDKYDGKAMQQMLIHLVFKVGKQLEPSVIFIGNCDRMFTKKLEPEIAALNPGRIKKDLMKAMKFITPEDRMLVVGTTKFPFKAAGGPMMKMFQRLIFIYPPSHGSRYALWEHLIRNFRGAPGTYFDISSLAKVSQGFTAGDILNAVREVLTEKRVQKQKTYPLKTKEFVNRMSTFEPVYQSELDAFRDWLMKTPLAKNKTKLAMLEEKGTDTITML